MAQERYRATVKSKSNTARKPVTSAKQPVKKSARPLKKGAAPHKKQLSSEEKARLAKRREAEKRRKEEALRQRAQRRAARRRLFKLCFTISLVFVVLYWVFVAVSIITRPDGSEDALPTKLFTEGERKEDWTLEKEDVTFGGIKYIPVTELTKYVALSQFGDYTTRSILLPSTGEYATFYIGTPEAIINGTHTALKDPSLLIDDVLYLPMDFFEKTNFFSYSANVTSYGADVLTHLSLTGTESFVFRSDSPCSTVDFATVPVAPTLPAEEETTP